MQLQSFQTQSAFQLPLSASGVPKNHAEVQKAFPENSHPVVNSGALAGSTILDLNRFGTYQVDPEPPPRRGGNALAPLLFLLLIGVTALGTGAILHLANPFQGKAPEPSPSTSVEPSPEPSPSSTPLPEGSPQASPFPQASPSAEAAPVAPTAAPLETLAHQIVDAFASDQLKQNPEAKQQALQALVWMQNTTQGNPNGIRAFYQDIQAQLTGIDPQAMADDQRAVVAALNLATGNGSRKIDTLDNLVLAFPSPVSVQKRLSGGEAFTVIMSEDYLQKNPFFQPFNTTQGDGGLTIQEYLSQIRATQVPSNPVPTSPQAPASPLPSPATEAAPGTVLPSSSAGAWSSSTQTLGQTLKSTVPLVTPEGLTKVVAFLTDNKGHQTGQTAFPCGMGQWTETTATAANITAAQACSTDLNQQLSNLQGHLQSTLSGKQFQLGTGVSPEAIILAAFINPAAVSNFANGTSLSADTTIMAATHPDYERHKHMLAPNTTSDGSPLGAPIRLSDIQATIQAYRVPQSQPARQETSPNFGQSTGATVLGV
ncbi:MAG: hypothetical protein SFZ03_04045 [Candidatus Melainabacteria bacterium]|nr:hypothetical protein [Candidatus Melainabacteria bacterium]